jgi:hypothetical protein
VLASVATVAAAVAPPVEGVVAVVPPVPPLVPPLVPPPLVSSSLVPPLVPPPLVPPPLVEAQLPVLVTVGMVAGAPTEATPMPVIGALTQVFPTVALLVWVQVKLMVIGPLPEVAVLPVDGVMVCVIDPVVPSPLPLVVPEVPVVPPFEVLFAVGDRSSVRLQPLFELLADGETVMVLPLTVPVPVAEGLLVTLELPPFVVLFVSELELAFALPEPDSSDAPLVAAAPDAPPVVLLPVFEVAAAPFAPLVVPAVSAALAAPAVDVGSSLDPLVALAVAAAPVVAPLVVEVADASLPVTEPAPMPDAGAVTDVVPTVAVLPCVVLAVTLAAPLPAVAVLLTDGVTVWLMSPVAPASSQSDEQDRLESAEVVVSPPDALLLA